MTTATANYGWQMPDPGGSANTWGNTLNATTQAIDALVFANAQAGVPVGAVTMWVGGSAPANWMVCNGASLSTSTYAALFAVIGYAFGGSSGSFNLPNMDGRFPVGAFGAYSLNDQGGENSHTLGLGELPSHAHPINDVTHSHAIGQTPHSHDINNPSHTHTAHDTGHAHSGGTQGASGGVALATGAGAPGFTGVAGANIVVDAATTSISVQAAYANINGNATEASGTGLSTTQNSGSGAAHENRPPFIALNFIIKVT